MAGQVWWNTDRRPTTTTTTTHTGGKGGGGGTDTSTSTITYDMDMLIGLTDNVIVGVSRIWYNGALVYTADSGATSGSIAASAATGLWNRLTVYTGEDGQLPDPTYEAAVGIGAAPAYRGRGSVFIEGLQLGQSGQVPNLTFEVVTDGSSTFGGEYATLDPTKTAFYFATLSGNSYSNDIPYGEASMTWCATVGDQFHPVGAGNGSWYCEFAVAGNECGVGVANDVFNVPPAPISSTLEHPSCISATRTAALSA